MKGSPTPAARLRRMYDMLFDAYGPQAWWPAETAVEVVIGAYLTQNTSWKAVRRSLENLRSAGALSIMGLRAISIESLGEAIRPSGFITRKAPALKAFLAFVDERFSGSLERMAGEPTEQLRSQLLQLPGVGPETADAILLYALGHPVPVADEYLRRIVERHRLTELPPKQNRRGYEALVEITRQAFTDECAEDRARHYNEFHALVVEVGKRHCGRVACCEACPLAPDFGSFPSSF